MAGIVLDQRTMPVMIREAEQKTHVLSLPTKIPAGHWATAGI